MFAYEKPFVNNSNSVIPNKIPLIFVLDGYDFNSFDVKPPVFLVRMHFEWLNFGSEDSCTSLVMKVTVF